MFVYGAVAVLLGGLAGAWFIGGRKLATVYGVCVVAGLVWLYHEGYETRASEQRQHAVARAAVRSFCLTKAGETGGRSQAVPAVVYLRVDSRLAHESGLRQSVNLPQAEEHLVLVDEPPVPLPSGAAYVDVALLREPIAGVPDDWLRGVSTTIWMAGETLAQRIDVERNPGWCLGEEPNDATERFIHDRLGVRIRFSDLPGPEKLLVPTAYPIATLGPAIAGRFAERPSTPGRNPSSPDRTTMLASMNCRVNGDNVSCAEGTPYANAFSLNDALALQSDALGWVLLSDPKADAREFDSVDLVRRNRDGVIEARWRLRLAAGPDPDRRGQMSASDFVLTPTGFAANILFDRHVDTVERSPPTLIEWYASKAHLESALPVPSAR
jgi:hypothetical protein